MAMFSSGCATDSARINSAAAETAEAGTVGQALQATRQAPDLPADCRRREASGVEIGDRLDVALVKTDSALGRANDRVTRCAAWHDALNEEKGT